MKTILLASVLAFAAASSAIGPTQAETIVIKKTETIHKNNYHRHMRTHCRTKVVTHWRHHRKVVEKIRVCS